MNIQQFQNYIASLYTKAHSEDFVLPEFPNKDDTIKVLACITRLTNQFGLVAADEDS